LQGIYKITNKVNDHCYVGQSIDIENRFKTHINVLHNKNQATYNYPLYRAMRKYGINNFEFEVLEIVMQEDDLTRREMYWYEKLEPEYCQIDPAKSISYVSKSVHMIDTDSLKILKTFNSIREAQRYLNVKTSKISDVCLGKRTKALNYHWCFTDDYSEDWKPKMSQNKIGVLAINKHTKEETKYDSIQSAANDLGVNYRKVFEAVHGITKNTRDWYFKKI